MSAVPATSGFDLKAHCADMGRRARMAARTLALLSTAQKDAWLQAAANSLESHAAGLIAANERDLAAADAKGLTNAQIDRLRLTPERIAAAASGMREVAALPDPIGRVLEGSVRPNGFAVTKVGVPLGVIFFIYESRPNVTVDAAALCVKSGNALILRGGKEAMHSNTALHRVLDLDAAGLRSMPCSSWTRQIGPRSAICSAPRIVIDLAIPRGGEGLIAAWPRSDACRCSSIIKRQLSRLCRSSRPTSTWRSAILVNAKCQRPGVCNAAESLLVHAAVAELFLPIAGRGLREQGVELRGCRTNVPLLPLRKPATGGRLCGRVPGPDPVHENCRFDLDEAMAHIARFGSGHTDAIMTNDLRAARAFHDRGRFGGRVGQRQHAIQ